VVMSATEALGQIGTKEAVPALIAVLRQDHDLDEQNKVVRRFAAEALGKMGREAVPSLVATLQDVRAFVRMYAAIALGQIGPEAEEAIPALIAALRDRDSSVRTRTVAALGKTGPRAKDGMPALIAALKDRDPEVSRSAATALGQIASSLFDTRDIG